MGEKQTPKRPLVLVPVPVHSEDRPRPSFLQQPSWWQLWRQWLHYHSTQYRWDIERWLARIFHHRWGG